MIIKSLRVFAIFVFLVAGANAAVGDTTKSKKPRLARVGWAERVHITPGDVLVHAKLVPGDETTSVHASDIEPFERDGKPWVRFTLHDRTGKKVVVERGVIREVKLKGAKKPVYLVPLGLCIAGVYEEAEVRLRDRSAQHYRMVIGRNVLAGNVVLDPSQSFTVEPKCANLGKANAE